MTPGGEALEVTLRFAEVLEELGVPYLVGGSLASSVHGIPRATLDVDLVADLRIEQVAPLIEALQNEFYLEEQAVREAVRDSSCFNAVHLASMFKVDVYPCGADPAQRREMKRRQALLVSREPERTLYVASAEDVVLMKLEWYRRGGGVSDRQWQDILGVLKVQGDRLDRPYLSRSAEQMKLTDLLERALDEAGGR